MFAISLTDVVLGGARFEVEEFIIVGLVVLLVSVAHCCCGCSKKRIRRESGLAFFYGSRVNAFVLLRERESVCVCVNEGCGYVLCSSVPSRFFFTPGYGCSVVEDVSCTVVVGGCVNVMEKQWEVRAEDRNREQRRKEKRGKGMQYRRRREIKV